VEIRFGKCFDDSTGVWKIILYQLLPEILTICPPEMRNKTIYIQQDTASPHWIMKEKVDSGCWELGISAVMFYQPSQSPDCNICDLYFFPSIQSRYFKIEDIWNVNDVVQAVKTAFKNYEANKLNRAFLSLMMNYNCILEKDGDNNYKMPHINKEILEKQGKLPVSLSVYGTVQYFWNHNVELLMVENEELSQLERDTFDEDNDYFSFHALNMEVEWLIDSIVNNENEDYKEEIEYKENEENSK
jgi:hypothetical protein